MDNNSVEKQRDRATGSRVLQAWFTAFKNIKLYKLDHPSSKDAARKLADLLNEEVFREKLSLSISNIDGLFMINDIFFIEESLGHYDLLRALEDHTISSVSFHRGVIIDEVIDFGEYLLKKRLPGFSETGFSSDHIKISIETKESWAKGHLRSVDSKYKGSESFIRMREHYDEWLLLAQNIFGKLLDEQTINISDFSDHLDQLIDEINQNPSTFSSMLAGIPLSHLHIQHSIHTMVYAIFLGQQLSLDAAGLKSLGLSALLHDIGRWFLPADFTTGYRLQPGDTDFIQLHSRDGASYLAGVPGLPMNIVRSALEHHIGYDGKGYPVLPGQTGADFTSQIIGIADFASWATVSEEYYHKPLPPHRLVRTLIARAGTQFDPLLVKLLIPFFGLYPTGTRVRLSSGETAVVIEPNIRNISRPKVAVRHADGALRSEWLMKLTSETTGSPYQKSITGLIGYADKMEIAMELVNDEPQ